MRRIINGINAPRLERFFCDYKPDVIVTTHFMTSEVVSSMKRRGKIQTQLVTCLTDARMHSFWYADNTDFFCVGFRKGISDLVKKWGFPEDKIKRFGIPIDSKYDKVSDKATLRNKLGLSGDLFTVLITGGGFGVGPIEDLVKVLGNMDAPLQLLVVCGHNEKLKEKIDKFIASKPDASKPPIIKNYGFVNYVDELMTVSDLIITKSGGLICSEALAKELPMLMLRPIPGQETRNCKLLVREKAAFKLKKMEQAKEIILNLCPSWKDQRSCGEQFKIMKENVRRIRTPNSSANIANFVIELVHNGKK